MFGSKIINYANSCIDISDGFSGDLFKLINNKYGINLYFDELPFSYQTKILLNKKIISISELLNGGDDYELLFTCSPKKDIKIINMALKNRIKITKIGRITHQKDTLSNVSKLKYFNKSYQYLF